ncbi:MAG: glycerate kinase [candidate division WOR-3 bacterium]|nr:glycerate kinase [candidate division WOR-3 bacterium]
MEFIKNYEELIRNSSKIRKDILLILESTLKETKPEKSIKHSVSMENGFIKICELKICTNKIKNIYVIGAGKATYQMAKALFQILQDKIKEGVIAVKDTPENKIGPIKVIKAGHPLPTEEGIQASREILSIAEKASEDDLIIALISGGGSALLPLPDEEIKLSELQRTNELLLGSGATINEINAVRKHISMVKGGRLSAIANPAMIISLIISDVVGDDLSSIASGLTAPDDSTFKEALSVLKRYDIEKKVPSSVLNIIKKGINGKIPETPSSGDPVFSRTYNRIILNNLSALKVAQEKAKKMGHNVLILSSVIEGESKEVGSLHSRIAREVQSSSNPISSPAIILSGGETTVTLDEFGNKKGGPNQECVLGFAEDIPFFSKAVFLSIDSDGIDGNSEFAGGIIGGREKSIDKKKILEALEYHTTTKFFQKIKGGILTGETGTNVNDIRILGIPKS